MIISLIAAVAKNNVIGKDNQLVWHLPDDMKFFTQKTRGHYVITGRKNYESIPEKFRPLPKRTNVVVSKQKGYPAPGAIVVSSIEEAIEKARSAEETEAFIIGGGEIYKQTINIADKLYITHILEEFDGDAFFPTIDTNVWGKANEEFHQADERHAYPFVITIYNKR